MDHGISGDLRLNGNLRYILFGNNVNQELNLSLLRSRGEFKVN